MSLRWKLHQLRPKHDRHMARAQSRIEQAHFLRREAKREKDRHRSKALLVLGWHEVRYAIAAVVDCGCPRDLWPANVRDMIRSEPITDSKLSRMSVDHDTVAAGEITAAKIQANAIQAARFTDEEVRDIGRAIKRFD